MLSLTATWIENTMVNFVEWDTEVWEYRNMILSSNHWLVSGWFYVAVQLPSRGRWQQEGVAWLRQIDYLPCDTEHMYWVTGDSFFLLFLRLRDPTVTCFQDELCPYLLLVNPVTGTPYVSAEFRHTFLVVLFWWQLLLFLCLRFSWVKSTML